MDSQRKQLQLSQKGTKKQRGKVPPPKEILAPSLEKKNGRSLVAPACIKGYSLWKRKKSSTIREKCPHPDKSRKTPRRKGRPGNVRFQKGDFNEPFFFGREDGAAKSGGGRENEGGVVVLS